MKKITLTVLLMLVHIIGNCANVGIFTPEDAKALGVKLDMKKNEIEKILGSPKKIESQYEDAFGADVFTCYYAFGVIRLEPSNDSEYTLSKITINKPNYKGPRNIEVGNSVKSVLQKFPYSHSIINEKLEEYIYGKRGDNYGCIFYHKTGQIKYILYSYGGDGFGTYALGMSVENDKIKTIEISVINV